MACSIAGTSSPFADDGSWHKDPNCLDAIADFNASYDASQSNNTIDPQLTFSNPHTPVPTHTDLFMNSPTSTGLNQTLSASPMSTYSDYPTGFNSPGIGPPYFQTIETNPPRQQYFPSPLGNNNNHHRRSVSEPPGQPPHHQQQQQQPQAAGIIFHRQHHFLGKPLPGGARAMPLKSVSRGTRQPRQHPYARPKSQHNNSNRGQTMAPTSMPFPQTQHPHSQQQHVFDIPPQCNMMMSPMVHNPSQYAVSRVCTPAPETPSPTARKSVKIDPSLTGGSFGSEVMKERLMVNVSVEELRELIFESVKRAVEEGNGQGKLRDGDRDVSGLVEVGLGGEGADA